jgi:type I restriction enzyme S subunit
VGVVPKAWDVKPLKHLADFVNGEAFKPTEWSDSGTPIIRIQNLNGGDDFNCYVGDVNPRHHVEKGDLLFGWSGNRGTSFGPFLWPREGLHYLNQHIFKVAPRECHVGWFYWCLKAVTLYVEQQAHGIIGMVHVTKGTLGAIAVPLPSEHDQIAIAAFLDRETGKIDALVAEQERLIALLKEKRQAVISQAVTKGLDPNAPMKDSGVEWLGQVPAHWMVGHIKRFCRNITDGAHISPETEGGVFDFVSTKDVGDDGIDFDGSLKTSPETYALMVRTGCRPLAGDILFSKDGTIGRTAIVNEDREFVVASSLIILRPDSEMVRSEYLHWLLQSSSVVSQVECFVKGAGLPRLSISNLLKVWGVFPPMGEQAAIAARITDMVTRYRSLIATSESAIAILKERRAALISAAVTGKIDVRGLVPEVQEAA